MINKICFIICFGGLLMTGVAQTHSVTIEIDTEQLGKEFEGIGTVSAGASTRLLPDYPSKQRNEILDLLFKPKYGASMQHLKVEIGGDVNSTCGTEPSHMHSRHDQNYTRGYEWWLMNEAKKRNPAMIFDALPWGAPAWIGNGNFFSKDMAQYVSNFVKGAKSTHGLDISYVGIWNERKYDIDYIKTLRRTLDENSLNHVKISAADEIRSYNIAKDMESDPELASAIAVIGTHYPIGQGEELWNRKSVYQNYGDKYKIIWDEAARSSKPIWSLEDGPWRGDWAGARGLAKLYTRCYIEAKMTKVITWATITSLYYVLYGTDPGLFIADQPWSGHYKILPAVWAMAHITQFTKPGWIYLDGMANGYLGNSPNEYPDCGGSFISLMSPDKKDLTILIENADSPQNAITEVSLDKNFNNKVFNVWESDSVTQFVRTHKNLKTVNGKLKLNIRAGSIVTISTTIGQSKAGANNRIPQSQPFPDIYHDNFNSYKVESLPKYTTDQAGCFEVVWDNNISNKILRQVSPARGIEWLKNTEPLTILGGMDKTNYSISIDTKFTSHNQRVRLVGRFTKYMRKAVLAPAYGYHFDVSANGDYSLYYPEAVPVRGKLRIDKFCPDIQSTFTHTCNSHVILYSDFVEKYGIEIVEKMDKLKEYMGKESNPEEIFIVLFSNNDYIVRRIKTLKKGKLQVPLNSWLNVKLSFNQDSIACYVDNRRVISITDRTYTHGHTGFGCSWDIMDFDNLKIDKSAN